MHDAANATLVDLVEIQMTELIRQASIVQRHTKRSRFASPGNSNSSGVPIHRRLLDAPDVNLALQWRRCDKLFLAGVGAPFTAPEDSGDAVVALNSYLYSEPIANPPLEVGMALHWLAVDGVQPSAAANPGVEPSKPAVGRLATSSLVLEDDRVSLTASSVRLAHKLLPHVVSEELRLYFLRVTATIEKNREDCSTAIESRAVQQQTLAILNSIGLDSGVQELVPFLVQFAEYQIYHSFSQEGATTKTPRYCRLLVQLIEGLLRNKHMHLELHLHHLIPPLLTCVVAHRVDFNTDYCDGEHYWLLRREAASTLANVVDIYGDQYTTLKARILKTMCEAAVSDKRPTQYRGIAGLSVFGPKAIEVFLLPLCVRHWSKWEKQLKMLLACNSKSYQIQLLEVLHCQQVLLESLGEYILSGDLCFEMSVLMEEEFATTFGEKFTSLAVHHSEYSSYFI